MNWELIVAIAAFVVSLGTLIFSAYTYSKHDKKIKAQEQIINDYQINKIKKEDEEKKEPPTEEQPSHSNASVVGIADKGKGETPLYSKDSYFSSAPLGTGSVGAAGCSAARPRRREVKGGVYDQSEYYKLCFDNYMLDLIDMRLGKLPKDDNLFWQAVNLYSDLYGVSDKKQAAKTVTHMVAKIIKASQ